MGMAARPLNFLAEFLCRFPTIEVIDGHVRAVRRQFKRDSFPETAGSASNESGASDS
jgi:hypothetical protein